MANSGIQWIDVTFDWCVALLYQWGGILGITYEEINVWLFCVILPIVLFMLCYEIIRLRFKLRALNG